MAINLTTNPTYSGRITATSADYPYGSSKNETTPGANDGTPYEKARADDVFGLQQAILEAVGAVPSGDADTATDSQYLQALLSLMTGYGSYRDVSGTADALVLTAPGGSQGVSSLLVGQSFRFRATTTNTGVTTVDPDGLGPVTAKTVTGVDLPAGYIRTDEDTIATFDGTNLVLGEYATTNALIKVTKLTAGTSVTLDPKTRIVFGYAVGAGTNAVVNNYPGEAGGTALFQGAVTGGASLTYAIGASAGSNGAGGATSITIGATTFSGYGGVHSTDGSGYAGGYASAFGGFFGGASNKGGNDSNSGGDSFLGGAGVANVANGDSLRLNAEASSGSGGAMSATSGGGGGDGCIILMEYR